MCRLVILLAVVVLLSRSAAIAAPAPRQTHQPISVENAERVQTIGELPLDVWRIVWGPKTGELSLLSWEDCIEVVDAATFKPIRKLGADKRLVHFAFSPMRDMIAWSENSKGVELIDLRTGKATSIETKDIQPSIAFSPDGKRAAITGFGTQAKLLEVPTGKLIHDLDTVQGGGLTPVFSPDGTVLAIGNRNNSTRLFDVASGKLLHELPRQMTQEIKFSPNGRTLAAGYVDGVVGLWNVADGKLLRSEASGTKEIYTLDWSPKGDLLVTAGLEGKIVLWEPQELKVLKTLESPEWVIQVRFSPDGTRLLSAGGKQERLLRKVVIWGLPEK